MKNIFLTVIAIIAMGSLFSCEPVEDRNSLPAMSLMSTDLNFTAVVNGNTIQLKNLTPDVIPYWSYVDSKGNELGHSNLNETSIPMPFAGTYTINFSAYTQGGSVTATKTVTISKNDQTLFSDPRWAMLTNGVVGKTWVFNMVTESPFAFVGGGYINKTVEGDWAWYPGSINDVSWSGVENKNWGEVTFDLNGGYNVKVTQTSLTTGSTVKTTKSGTYNFSLTTGSTNDRIILNGGIEMLHLNAYYNDVMSGFSFSNVRLIELTASSLRYAAIRNDGVQVVMNLVPKS
ncbi:hypothetical protein [Flavobacterium undicola]|uniref:hypothetical protein n=1 Tax=Flavobacterium undicola TaxID=1932779 RepID=UPI0013784340|nr:hypothetical protein [Flavobacterium undicola]MBA0882977.1 hypothetical protein [Flavobacterium undicola]